MCGISNTVQNGLLYVNVSLFWQFEILSSMMGWSIEGRSTKGDNKLHVVIYLFIYEMAVIHWKDSTVYLHQVTWMEVI